MTAPTANGCGRRSSAHFIGLLIDHKQPECAETFFNSVSVKTLRRGYYHNRFIFVRPAISTEHIDADPPSYRSYYPLQQGLRHALIDIVLDFNFERRFADFGADLAQRARPRSAAAFRGRSASRPTTRSRCCRRRSSATRPRTSSGASSTASTPYPFVVPVKHDAAGKLYFDALSWTRSTSRYCSPRTAPISWSTWKCPRPMSISCARSCRTRRPPSSTRWSDCRKRGRTCSSATSCTTSSTRATSSSSRRGSRVS